MVRIGKQLTRRSVGALLALAAALGRSASAQRVSLDTFFVSVRSDSGRPLPNSGVVILTSRREPVLNATTDSEGVAKFSPIPPAPFTLLVRQVNYQQERLTVKDVGAPVSVVLKKSPIVLTEVCLTYAVGAIGLAVDSAISSGTASITARVRDGSFSEVQKVELPSSAPLAFAIERAGTYEIEVTAHGYERWARSNVRVVKAGCHVVPQTFRVRLTRSRR